MSNKAKQKIILNNQVKQQDFTDMNFLSYSLQRKY